MDDKSFWSGFVETGDPVCYLLAKKLEQQPRRDTKQTEGAGEEPRPSD